MSFLKLIIKNPFRNKSRAILSILGITIGILVIISLGSISDGLVNSMEETNSGKFMVMNNTMGNYGTPSNFNESVISNIKNIDGIERVAGLIQTQNIENGTNTNIIGLNKDDLNFMDISLSNGTVYNSDKEIIIGKIFADNNNKKINDKILIKNQEYTITGIYETGDRSKDNTIIMDLKPARNIGNLKDDELFSADIKVKSGYDFNQTKLKVNSSTPEDIIALTNANELESVQSMMNIINSATFVISGLAIIIGGLGVVNSMLMSVFDRIKEIGLLKAVGWSNKRIITMILGESLIITISSFLLASIIAIGALSLISYLGYFTATFTIKTFGTALFVSIAVGLLGGFYPAYKASKYQPTEALRYE